MAEKKISQLTAKGATVADTDLLVVSESAGGGTYVTKSVTGANVKGLVTDANLTTTDITTNDVSTSKHGFAPKAPNDTTKFLRGDGTWAVPASGSSAIPQTDLIYVDAVLGADNADAGRGNIEKPYASVEYVLANTTNTGTVTGNTTSGSATIISVSSTTNIKVGQYITGTNIPYNSVVISKTSNTIVLSQTATGTGSTITFTWWTPKTIRINGDIVATSNWFKPAFWFDCGDANITWGNFDLFSKSAACLVPEVINGGNWYGNHASSRFIYSNAVSSSHEIFVNILSYISIGTGYQIWLWNAGSYLTFNLNCNSFNAKFGYTASLQGTNASWSGYKYGLLGSLSLNNSSSVINDTTECPSSVLAISSTSGSNLTVNGTVYGSVDTRGMQSRVNFNSGVIGTTIGCGTNLYDSHVFASVYRQTITVAGNAIFNFIEGATINQSAGTLIVNSGNVTYSGSAGVFVMNGYHRSDFDNTFTLSGSCQVFLNNDCGKGSVSVGSGTVFTINGKYRCQFGQHDGTVTVLKGAILQADRISGTSYRITGSLNVYGEIQLLRTYGSEVNESVTPTLPLSTGTIIVDSGKISCALANSLSGLITKYGTGGVVVLKGQCYLKSANGLAPLYIKSNTGTSQDIFDFSMVGNGASGFRLADTFTNTTYGTAYAPNLLVGGVHYQSTTYSF
jgi:hypothetical protein